MPNDETINQVRSFLSDTETALKWVLTEEGSLLVIEELLDPLNAAWNREVQLGINEAHNWLEGAKAQTDVGRVRRENLDNNGFTDLQWAPKWRGFEIARDAFRGALEAIRGIRRIGGRTVARTVAGLFMHFLIWIDLVLGSLVKAIAQLEPVREFKEAVEKAVG